MRPIHLLRYGLPGAFVVAGVVMIVVGNHTIADVGGIMLIGDAVLVFFVNAMARLMISSQDDRDREQEARETFARTGRWPDARARHRRTERLPDSRTRRQPRSH